MLFGVARRVYRVSSTIDTYRGVCIYMYKGVRARVHEAF